MFGVCFSFFLAKDVRLKRKAGYHSTCSTYAALAILFFLPAISAIAFFFSLNFPLCAWEIFLSSFACLIDFVCFGLGFFIL